MFGFFVGIVIFILVCLVSLCICTALVIVQATLLAARTGSAWVAKRHEQQRHLTALAEVPETYLLRGGDVPASPPDVLVRPVDTTPSANPEELLRVAEE